METHSLRDREGNGGHVKLAGKPMSWLLDDCGDAASHLASSWRNEMKERILGLCMLNHEYGLRKTARTKLPREYESSLDEVLKGI